MLCHCSMFNWALHKKSWAVIDRPYSLGCAIVGALYERPRCIFCAKPFNCHFLSILFVSNTPEACALDQSDVFSQSSPCGLVGWHVPGLAANRHLFLR